MNDYSERNLFIIQESMQELGILDCEEIHAAIRLLKEIAVKQQRAADYYKAHVSCPQCAWLFDVNLPVISG